MHVLVGIKVVPRFLKCRGYLQSFLFKAPSRDTYTSHGLEKKRLKQMKTITLHFKPKENGTCLKFDSFD